MGGSRMRDTSIDEIYDRFYTWYDEHMSKEISNLDTPYKETIKTMIKIGWLEGANAQEQIRSRK